MLDLDFLKLRGEDRIDFDLGIYWHEKEQEFVDRMEMLRAVFENTLEATAKVYSCEGITLEKFMKLKEEMTKEAKRYRRRILSERKAFAEYVRMEYALKSAGCKFENYEEDREIYKSFNKTLEEYENVEELEELKILADKFAEKGDIGALRAIGKIADIYDHEVELLHDYFIIDDPYFRFLISESYDFVNKYFDEENRIIDSCLNYRIIEESEYPLKIFMAYHGHEVDENGRKIPLYKTSYTVLK